MATAILRSAQVDTDQSVVNAIRLLVTYARSAGMFFDFDGVLSPIQDDPWTVQPLAGIPDLLRSLVQHVSTVTVLSSRPAAFLRDRFPGADGLNILGLYGFECIGPSGEIEIVDDAKEWKGRMQSVCEAAMNHFRSTAGILVEDKKLTVALHYRAAPHRKEEVENWAQYARLQWGVDIQPGRLAVELRPPIPVDKGSILAKCASSLSTVWYCGDDLGDLPAMSYVQKRRRCDESFCGLTIGVGNNDIVEEVFCLADVFVDSPQTLKNLLSETLRAFV